MRNHNIAEYQKPWIKDVPKGTHPQMCSVQTYIKETDTCRFQVTVRLLSGTLDQREHQNNGKNTRDVYTCLMARVALICSKHILALSVIYF